MTAHAQLTFSNMPLSLILVPEGKRWAIAQLAPIHPTYTDVGGIEVVFDDDGYVVNGMPFRYNMTYEMDCHPSVVQWLQTQHLMLTAVSN